MDSAKALFSFRKFLYWLSIVLLTTITVNAEFKVPPLTGRVVDAGKAFTEEESAQIEAAILRLESATGGQMVVTTLPSLEGLSIEDVGIRLGDAWKIGNKGKDDGAILIIAVPERKMRLEVGLGWEGSINDARAGDVIRGLAPFFRANKYADGAVWAVESVQQYVTGKEVERTVAVPATNGSDSSESDKNDPLYTGLGVLCSLPLFALLFYCLWAIFVYAVIMPIWLLLYLIFALCGKELPTFDPASLLGLGFLADWADSGSGSSGSSSSGSSSYSSSSSSSSSSHYSGGGGRFGGGGASGGW